MSFGERILEFFDALQPPHNLPEGVGLLWPYSIPEVKRIMRHFYLGFLGDTDKRVFLIGINPGRFGAGVTGIGFTDPIRLTKNCGIEHSLTGGREISSDFIYRIISAFGGPQVFYRRFYITALSPAGFIRNSKNLNYYDVKGLPELLDDWMARAMEKQREAGVDRRVAFSLGRGANFKHLEAFNNRHGFFDCIKALPHPRWVMQYRYKRLEEFIQLYIDSLSPWP